MIETYAGCVVAFVALVAEKHVLCVWVVANDACFRHRPQSYLAALDAFGTVFTRILAHR